jgi:uncharacterized membrane protein
MNEAHIHLLVNHFPIILPVVGILILVTGLLSKSEAVKRTAYMIFILGALTTIFAMKSGEGAEDVIKKLDETVKDFIHEHEEAAETFAIVSYVMGLIAIIGLWASFQRKKFSNTIVFITLIFAFVVLFFARETGTTGGEINHPEIRYDHNQNIIERLDEQSNNV